MEEANEEAEHKGWCDTELGTNEQTRKEKTAAVQTYVAILHHLMNSLHHLDTSLHSQSWNGQYSVVSPIISAIKSVLESAWRDLQTEKHAADRQISETLLEKNILHCFFYLFEQTPSSQISSYSSEKVLSAKTAVRGIRPDSTGLQLAAER